MNCSRWIMLCIVRTTISLDEHLGRQVRRRAAAQGLSVSAFICKVLDHALKQRMQSEPPPFHLVTVRNARVRAGVDLDSSGSLDTQDDRARFAL